ncbi:MAG TPA: hypothetical protein VE825_14565 [Terriglobales bacterium]|nr:hypothetical protein [Terriglobales bacterium]
MPGRAAGGLKARSAPRILFTARSFERFTGTCSFVAGTLPETRRGLKRETTRRSGNAVGIQDLLWTAEEKMANNFSRHGFARMITDQEKENGPSPSYR